MLQTQATMRFYTNFLSIDGLRDVGLSKQMIQDSLSREYFIQLSVLPTDPTVSWPLPDNPDRITRVTVVGTIAGAHKLITGEYHVVISYTERLFLLTPGGREPNGEPEQKQSIVYLVVEKRDDGYAVNMRGDDLNSIQSAWRLMRQGNLGKPIVAYEPMPAATDSTSEVGGQPDGSAPTGTGSTGTQDS